MGGELLLFALFALITAGAAACALWAYARAGGRHPGRAVAALGAAGAGLIGLYAIIGRPALPDAPYAQRIHALEQRAPESYTDEELLARLAADARQHPDDPRPHLATGILLLRQERVEDAARAFDAALRRDPRNLFAMLNLARSLVVMNDGRITEDALRLFAAVSSASPDDPTPWLYQALAATQSGRKQDAHRLWGETLQRLPAGDPRRQMARQMRDEAAR